MMIHDNGLLFWVTLYLNGTMPSSYSVCELMLHLRIDLTVSG